MASLECTMPVLFLLIVLFLTVFTVVLQGSLHDLVHFLKDRHVLVGQATCRSTPAHVGDRRGTACVASASPTLLAGSSQGELVT